MILDLEKAVTKLKRVCCFAVIPLFLVLISLIIAINHNSVFVVFIDRFQTLIAGFLAVLAAFITVFQMRISEQNQIIRHQENIDIAIRSDKRLVARETKLNALRGRAIVKLHNKISHPKFKANHPKDVCMNDLLSLLRHMTELMNSLEKGEVKRYFSPDAFTAMEFLIEQKHQFTELKLAIKSAMRPNDIFIGDRKELVVNATIDEAIGFVCVIYPMFAKIQKCILELMVEYRIDTSFMEE